MKNYYINIAHLKAERPDEVDQEVVALFTENNHSGEGNFCGWYASEFYNNTKMIAFYKNRKLLGQVSWEPKSEIEVENRFYPKIRIGSGYWEKIIQAESDDEALKHFEKFRLSYYKPRRYEEDED